jgi:histidine triad (HIT) family protein
MSDCLFCKIRDGQIPAQLLYTDVGAVAFSDINPQAPLHALVIPRRHIASLDAAAPEDAALLGHLFVVGAKLAREAGHAAAGYRVVLNTNPAAGQTVFHVHLHVLGGRTFAWPPG